MIRALLALAVLLAPMAALAADGDPVGTSYREGSFLVKSYTLCDGKVTADEGAAACGELDLGTSIGLPDHAIFSIEESNNCSAVSAQPVMGRVSATYTTDYGDEPLSLTTTGLHIPFPPLRFINMDLDTATACDASGGSGLDIVVNLYYYIGGEE